MNQRLVSQADGQRRAWDQVNKALVEVQKPGKTKNQRAAEAGGATAAVLGGTAYAGSIPVKNKAARLAGESEAVVREAEKIKRKRSSNVLDYVHTIRGGGEPKTGGAADSPPRTPKHGREWAKHRANFHRASAAADRATQAKATTVGRIGLGVAVAGAGGYGYAKHRQSRKKEFGKALTKEQAEERKGPQLPKNPVVTGGLGTAALGSTLFAGSRIPYHARMHEMRTSQVASTDAKRQAQHNRDWGDKALKESYRRKSRKMPGPARGASSYFKAGEEAEAKSNLLSTKSTTARAKAIKTASIGRKGLYAAVGGGAAAGAGLAYDKYKKRKEARA